MPYDGPVPATEPTEDEPLPAAAPAAAAGGRFGAAIRNASYLRKWFLLGLTIGVIAARGEGEATKRYLRDFVGWMGLERHRVLHDSGHLTRCRTPDSPVGRGRVLLAGDAAGLLEPWTREGISFATRSGALAGAAAAGGADGVVELRDRFGSDTRELAVGTSLATEITAAITG